MTKFPRELIQEILIAVIAALAGFASTQLRDMTQSMQQLNTNVAVLVERVTNQGDRIEEMDRRITTLESRRR